MLSPSRTCKSSYSLAYYALNQSPYSVPVTLTGGPAQPEVKSLPKHKKNPEVGEKKTVYSSQIFVEQEDAISFDDQEEVWWRAH